MVQPQRDDQVEVNGEILTAESSLANLRAACRTYGISTSGSKTKVFRKLVEHQKGLHMEAVFHASTLWTLRSEYLVHQLLQGSTQTHSPAIPGIVRCLCQSSCKG